MKKDMTQKTGKEFIFFKQHATNIINFPFQEDCIEVADKDTRHEEKYSVSGRKYDVLKHK